MKKENFLLACIIVIFIGMIYHDLVRPRLVENSTKADPKTESIVYSEEFTERLREEVITELYGSRETYATEQTGSRADYVDKEASMSGELVIDEERMQQVYDSKLKEFDEMVDQAKVDEIVKERQNKLSEEKAFKGYGEKEVGMNREVMYWNAGGRYFGMIVLAGMAIFIIIRKIKRNN